MVLALNLKGFFLPFFFFAKNAAASAMVLSLNQPFVANKCHSVDAQ